MHKKILTVAVCLTDEDITTGFMDMLSTDFAKVLVKQWITKTNEKINLICVNARFRIAELFWLCKSIEMSTIFMERKTLLIRNLKNYQRNMCEFGIILMIKLLAARTQTVSVIQIFISIFSSLCVCVVS